jgi:hypothetical protein
MTWPLSSGRKKNTKVILIHVLKRINFPRLLSLNLNLSSILDKRIILQRASIDRISSRDEMKDEDQILIDKTNPPK